MVSILDGGIHVTHRKGFEMKRPKGVKEYLLLLIKTEAVFYLNGEKQKVTPTTILLIDRNTPYHYENPKGTYTDSWILFEQRNMAKLRLLLNQFFICQNTNQVEIYLQQLLWEKEYAPCQHKKENTENLFEVLINNLLDLYERREDPIQKNPYYHAFRKLRLDSQSDPSLALTAKEAADSLDISLSHFHHLYKQFFQETYVTEVVRFKIQQAQTLLLTTNLTVDEIIKECGYSNNVHFYRQFKKITHLTPTEFRMKNGAID
ncbi:MAG TPA: AraC family transcriptional regulator [Candidatus Tetragenococcus pullicola]|nr:AraC family transcriptional regulator [Candidatus Tetragenococcus pullicola]